MIIKKASHLKKLMLVVVFFGLLLPRSGVRAEVSFKDIAKELMSPACPGKLLADCTSGEAKQLRELIIQKIRQGETKEDIIKYFVDVYGEQILASPPKRGFYLTAWTLPLLVIIYGALMVYLIIRLWLRKGSQTDESLPVETSESHIDDLFKQKLEKELREFQGF